MRSIKIEISKAVIQSFEVKLGTEKPEVSVVIALLTAQGKKITTYTVDTNSWNDEQKFELPLSLIIPIKVMLKAFELIAVKHCQEGQKQLKEPKK